MGTHPTSRPTQVRAVIWHYLEATSGSAVSVRDAMRFVRKRVPRYGGSEKELSDLVGTLATAAGRNVHFDAARDEPEEPA